MLIDTHCHLTDERLKNNIEEVLERARAEGVKKIIAPSTSLEDAKQAVKIANKFKGVYALVGVHPEHVQEITNYKLQITKLKKLIKSSKKVVGVGEIGLDFHYDKEKKTKNEQIKLFKAQLELAVELELPVAIHAREAKEETMEVLEGLKERNLPKGVFHCWSEDKEFLRYVLGKGFCVSFCGNVTYLSGPTSEQSRLKSRTVSDERPSLRELVRRVPLNKLLLETDAPYLAPEPLRGRLNEPKNVKITAKFMANVLGTKINTLINQTTKNSLCLFRLES